MRREVTLVMVAMMALVSMGVLMVYSASAVGGQPHGLLSRQAIYVALGFLGLLFTARFDYHRFRDPVVYRLIVLGSLTLLLLVLVPGVGKRVDGAQRWISVGGFGFQPSELAKFALILLMAVKLTENQNRLQKFWAGFMPPMVIAGLFAALVYAERDLGVPVVLMFIAMAMMWMAGVRQAYLFGSSLLAIPLVFVLSWTHPHRVERLMAFWDPWAHRDDESFQLVQSLAAFAQGGIWGRGIGASEQKLFYLPAAHTDFIFAVIGEEMGLIGTLSVIGLFCLLVVAAFRIAMNAQDLFGSLLAGGVTVLIAFQASFIMAVTVGLLPTKGLPLPFISWGGTALIVFMTMTGVLMNVGAQARLPDRRFLAVAPAHL